MEEARAQRPQSVGLIRAAGGLVVRDNDEEREVLLVHRPKYDDWSFPKGKAREGESDEDCALREVEEETGYRCEIVGPAGETRYRVLKGPKRVTYYEMRVLEGEFEPHDEIDAVCWAGFDEAADTLTWARDARLLRSFT